MSNGKPRVGSLLQSQIGGGLAADSAAHFADTLQRKGMSAGEETSSAPEPEVAKIKTSIHFPEDVVLAVNHYRVAKRLKLSDVVTLAVRQFLEREANGGDDAP